MPLTLDEFADQLVESTLFEVEKVAALRQESEATEVEEFARWLVREKKLTAYQAQQLYAGKGRSLVLGNYALLDKLGQGGMGMVLKAQHRRMKRLVALKVVSPAAVKTKDLLQRFQREVEAAARLSHPNIVQAHDSDEVRGIHFLVMEYVEGSDLASLVKAKGPLPIDAALNCILQAARGLEYAHRQGVVHRDIKPANLLINREWELKVLDMGLARLTGEADGHTDLTTTGNVMGTIDYMAPEQAENTHTAGPPADIYSLGCTLHFLLTGRPTYDGESTIKRLLAHREAPIPSLRSLRGEVPADVDALFARMVAKRPEERFPSMAEVITAIEQCQSPREGGPSLNSELGEDSRFSQFLNGLDAAAPQESATAATVLSPTQPVVAANESEAATMITGDPVAITGTLSCATASDIARRKTRAAESAAAKRRWLWTAAAGFTVLLCGIIIRITTKDGRTIEHEVEPGSKIEIVEKTASNTPAATLPEQSSPQVFRDTAGARDRAAAEWFAGLKGGTYYQLQVRTATNKIVTIPQGGTVPSEKFSLLSATCQGAEVTSADLDRFVDLPQLQLLRLSGSRLDRSAIDRIARIPLLSSLDISSTDIRTSHLTPFSRLRVLESLDLASSQIDDDWKFLQQLPSLRSLKVFGDSPADLGKLGEYKQLRLIVLSDRKTDVSVAVAEIQQRNPDVTIMQDGARRIGEPRDLQAIQSLVAAGVHVELYHRRTDEEVRLSDLSQQLDLEEWKARNIQSLPPGTIVSADIMTALDRACVPLVTLVANEVRNADLLATEIVRYGLLGNLHLQDSDLTDDGLMLLSRHVGLRTLRVTGTLVTPAAVAEFRRRVPACGVISDFGTYSFEHRLPPPVEDAQGGEGPMVSGSDIYARDRAAAVWFAGLQGEFFKLQIQNAAGPHSTPIIPQGGPVPEGEFTLLSAGCNKANVTSSDLDRLVGLPHLTSLHLAESQIDSNAIERLVRIPLLCDLNISNTAIRTSELRPFAQLPLLTTLVLSAKQVDDDWEFLRSLPKVRNLTIYGGPPEQIQRLGEFEQLRSIRFGYVSRAPDPEAILSIQNRNPRITIRVGDSNASRRIGEPRDLSAALQLAASGVPMMLRPLSEQKAIKLTAPRPVEELETCVVEVYQALPPGTVVTQDLVASLDVSCSTPLTFSAKGTRGADVLAAFVRDVGSFNFLYLEDTDLTDAGLALLAEHTGLRKLHVNGTPVTREAIDEFRRRVPACRIVSDFGEFLPEYRLPPAYIQSLRGD